MIGVSMYCCAISIKRQNIFGVSVFIDVSHTITSTRGGTTSGFFR